MQALPLEESHTDPAKKPGGERRGKPYFDNNGEYSGRPFLVDLDCNFAKLAKIRCDFLQRSKTPATPTYEATTT